MITIFKGTSRSLFKVFKNIFQQTCKNSNMDLYGNHSEQSVGNSEHYTRIKCIKEFIPKLTTSLRKGQCGRVGIIGGSSEYTGAPYFAAISSLKGGVDLVHVFCCRQAATVIKSYSPELIVHPVLDNKDAVSRIYPFLERMNVLVIGPGLGRDTDVLRSVVEIITHCKTNMKKPPALIIDADGLYLISEDLNVIKDYPGPLILTPNSGEYSRLCDKMGSERTEPLNVAVSLNAVLVQKGYNDVITNGMHNARFKIDPSELSLKCDTAGSNRRCGGQGDVLSGLTATFVAWVQIYFERLNFSFRDLKEGHDLFHDTCMRYSWAVYGACVVTRTCSRIAFEEHGRGMTASDMIAHIPKAFKLHFGM